MDLKRRYSSVLVLLWLVNSSRSECPSGNYGVDCKSICGHCTTNTSCDKASGICMNGCEKGWKTLLCNISYPMLRHGPVLEDRNKTAAVITWTRWKTGKDIGEGIPKFYLVQLRNASDKKWKTLYQKSADDWSENNDGFEVVLSNLSLKSTNQLVRVVVMDESNESQEQLVPVLIIPATGEPTEHFALDYIRFKKLFINWFTWTAVAIVVGVIFGLMLVLYIECCRRKSRNIARLQEPVEMQENNSSNYDQGLVNAGYVTLRSQNGRRYTKSNMKPSHIPNKVDWSTKDKSRKLSARSNQTVATLYCPGKWREAVPGLRDSRMNEPSTCSWYTEWYDSRVYENHREAPEELIVDQTLKRPSVAV